MAIITPDTHFDADAIDAKVVGIAAELGQHDSGIHQHNKGQLLYAPQGCITLTLEKAICILPPTKAVWIPPGTMHRAQMTNVVAYRSIYFDVNAFECPTDYNGRCRRATQGAHQSNGIVGMGYRTRANH